MASLPVAGAIGALGTVLDLAALNDQKYKIKLDSLPSGPIVELSFESFHVHSADRRSSKRTTRLQGASLSPAQSSASDTIKALESAPEERICEPASSPPGAAAADEETESDDNQSSQAPVVHKRSSARARTRSAQRPRRKSKSKSKVSSSDTSDDSDDEDSVGTPPQHVALLNVSNLPLSDVELADAVTVSPRVSARPAPASSRPRPKHPSARDPAVL